MGEGMLLTALDGDKGEVGGNAGVQDEQVGDVAVALESRGPREWNARLASDLEWQSRFTRDRSVVSVIQRSPREVFGCCSECWRRWRGEVWQTGTRRQWWS